MPDPDNPLVAPREDSTEWYTGIGIAEGIADLHGAFNGGGWIDGLIGGFGTGPETLSLVVDPLGTLASWGVAWLIEHVKPLSDALDWLAGDPDQINAYAATWKNVAKANGRAAQAYAAAVGGDVPGWGGDAGSAYRGRAAGLPMPKASSVLVAAV